MATYGPDSHELTVHTKRGGAAAKAGHDLTILVESWNATYDDGELVFEADSSSFRVVEGSGGAFSLGDDEKAGIKQTIDEEILKGSPITYRGGELTLNGSAAPGRVQLRRDRGQRVGQADGFQDQAVLGAVRDLEGRRRRRGQSQEQVNG